MCRRLLQHLAGGPFPVARYSAAARNNKRQDRRCFPLSLAFGSCPIDRRSPCRLGVTWQTQWRRPGTVSLDGVGDSHGTVRKPGDGLADSARRRMTATRNVTAKDQRPCSIGMIRMWLRRVVTLPFPDSHGRIGPYDRGYRLDSPWAGIMAPRRPVRSDVLMGCEPAA